MPAGNRSICIDPSATATVGLRVVVEKHLSVPIIEVESGAIFMLDVFRARDRMVDVQIARRGVRDPHVLAATRRVPREAFRRARLRGVRLRGRAAADRVRTDHFTALHRRADD
jgi:hypothetical protein